MEEKEKNVKKEYKHKKVVLSLEEFASLDAIKQSEKIKELLLDMYNNDFDVTRKHVLKVISLMCTPKDATTYFPYNLKIEKSKNKITFDFDKRKNFPVIVYFIGAFLFMAIGATYSAIFLNSRQELNKDIDGDGIADINLDINGDGVCELNCDVNNDDIPDYNIDYKGNKKSIFSIDTTLIGVATANLINIDTSNDDVCDLNCDINNDGWPDINIDYNGDGIADLDIDTDKDKIADLNLDIDGNGICDIMCDTNGDGKCDKSCIVLPPEPEEPEKPEEPDEPEEEKPQSGPSHLTGDPNVDTTTGHGLIIFSGGGAIVTDNIFPDDQEGYESNIPDKVVTVENTSSYPSTYALQWIVEKNNFVSDNYKFKVEATNGGKSVDWTTVPKENFIFVSNVVIPGNTLQTYKISFVLKGVNAPQNYDQGRTFKGYINLILD